LACLYSERHSGIQGRSLAVVQELSTRIANVTQSVARFARIAPIVVPEQRIRQLGRRGSTWTSKAYRRGRASLGLGEVLDTFTVTINGQAVSFDQISAEADAVTCLEPGRNTIVIRVATTIDNPLAKVGRGCGKEGRRAEVRAGWAGDRQAVRNGEGLEQNCRQLKGGAGPVPAAGSVNKISR
jgi:hypothetical protein